MTAHSDAYFAGSDHDHGNCISSALDSAAAVCQQRGVRLTPRRRQVLELVWQSHRPIGAYAVLDALQADRRETAARMLREADSSEEEAEAIYKLSALCTFDERFVIPPMHREEAIEMMQDPLEHKQEAGFGFLSAPRRGM